MKYLITGGCGFIGSNFGDMVLSTDHTAEVTNIDIRTAISNSFLAGKYLEDKRYLEFNDNVCNQEWHNIVQQPDVVIHFAAESHVDKSLTDLDTFISSNIQGTASVAKYCIKHDVPLIFVSTDEVYGELRAIDAPFKETDPVNPRNPYSATKASAEFLVRSLGNANPQFRYLITRCSNNFGPWQDGSKLIPVCINRILDGKKIPIYGEGAQIRDWIHVKDHCQAISDLVIPVIAGQRFNGSIFNVGADNELTNLELVKKICEVMEVDPNETISFVPDPRNNAHDFRYAIDSSKLSVNTYWKPLNTHPFDESLRNTIEWYRNIRR